MIEEGVKQMQGSVVSIRGSRKGGVPYRMHESRDSMANLIDMK